MDSVREGSASSNSTRHDAAARVRAFLFGATACFVAAPPAPSAETPPRAQAVIAATQLAHRADTVLQTLPRVAWQLGGLRGRIDAEFTLAVAYAALSDDELANRYWRPLGNNAAIAGDTKLGGIALIARIQGMLAQGDYARGQELADELMQLARGAGSDNLTAFAEEYQGVFERRRGNLDAALEHQTTALTLRRKNNDASGEATALTNLGTIARDKGDFAQCLDYFLQALAIRERIDNRLDVAYRNLALLYRELDDRQTTQAYFTRAVEAATRYAQPGYYASVQGAYAGFLNDNREYDAALKAASDALAVSAALDNRPSVGFEHLEVGRALLGLRKLDEAAPHFDAAFDIGRELDQREMIARSELALAEIALSHGDLTGTHRLLDEVSPRLNAAGLRPYLAQAYWLRDLLAEAEHDPATAHEYAHRHTGLKEELLGVRSSRLLAAIEVRKAREQSQQQLELAVRNNELQAERLARSQRERFYTEIAIAGLALIVAVFGTLLWRLRGLNLALAARNEQNDRQRAALTEANELLGRQAQSLYQASIIDVLTGAHSRSYVLDQFGLLLAECRRSQRELTVLLIDFDHFKLVNDRHGHLAGDHLLAEAARIMRDELPADSLLGRFGGEEFLAVLVDRDEDESRRIAEHVRATVAERMGCIDPPTTISIGAATLRRMPEASAIDLLIDAADRALYAAKQAGRNQVQGFRQA